MIERFSMDEEKNDKAMMLEFSAEQNYRFYIEKCRGCNFLSCFAETMAGSIPV